MFSKSKLLGASVLAFVWVTPVAQTAAAAQTDSAAVSASTSTQAATAQTKADRKALRAKKNAELGALEKNGYNLTSNELDYPQDLQRAEGTVSGGKMVSVP